MFIYVVLLLVQALTFAQQPDPGHSRLEQDVFNALDIDKDGKISETEHEKNENAILAFDTDKDGEVSEAEFKVGIDKLSPILVGHEDAVFALMDYNNDKKVDKADIDASFTAADTNGDREIEKNEFHVIFQKVQTHVG